MILRFTSKTRRGYVLFEAILALAVFALAVMGLARALTTAIETSGILSKENEIRTGLRSFVEEIRRKPIAEMAASVPDERLGVTFNSTIDPLSLKDRNGTVLNDLYTLHASASYEVGSETREESVDVYVYKPANLK